MPSRIYCLSCGRVRPKRARQGSVATWRARLPEGVLLDPAEALAMHLPAAVCETCTHALTTDAYEIITTNPARAARLPSRVLRAELGVRTHGLLALDRVPAGATLPYPGEMLGEHELAALPVQYSHSHARGGVKERGERTILLGQLAVADKRHCAHFINAAKGLPAGAANCTWDWHVVDAAFERDYPRLVAQTGVARGERYPVVRVTRNVLPGQELLLRSYGEPYWARMAREATRPAGLVHDRLRFLSSGSKRQLAALRDPRERQKRQRRM